MMRALKAAIAGALLALFAGTARAETISIPLPPAAPLGSPQFNMNGTFGPLGFICIPDLPETATTIRKCVTTIKNGFTPGQIILHGTSSPVSMFADLTANGPLPLNFQDGLSIWHQINWDGIEPTLTFSGTCGSTEDCWTLGSGGSVLDGGGYLGPIFAANTSSVTTPSTSTFWLNAVTNVLVANIGAENAQSFIQIGGHNNIGAVSGEFRNLYALNMSGWAFQFTNSHHPTWSGRIWVNDNSESCTASVGGIDFEEDVPNSIQLMGNMNTTADLQVWQPANCRLSHGIKVHAAQGTLGLFNDTGRNQSINSGSLLTEAASMSNASNCIGVADSTQYEKGMPVWFSAVVNGLTAVTEDSSRQATLTYIVHSITPASCPANSISIGLTQNGADFTATGSTAVSISSYAEPLMEVYADSGALVDDSSFMHLDLEGTRPVLYCENATLLTFIPHQFGNAGTVLFRNGCQSWQWLGGGLNPHTDIDSASNSGFWLGKLGDILNQSPSYGLIGDTTQGGGQLCAGSLCPLQGALQLRFPPEGSNPIWYPVWAMNWKVDLFNNLSFTLRNNECNGGLVVFNGTGNAAWTMPVISTTNVQASNYGMHCIIRVVSAHTVTLTAGTGNTFGNISGNTTYVLNQGDVVMFIANPVTQSWDVELRINGTQFAEHYGAAQLQRYLGGTLAQSTTVATLASTSDTSVFGAGTGTQTIPANWAYVGAQFRIKASGIYSTPAANTATVTAKIKWGSTVLASITTGAMPASATNDDFSIDETCTVQSIGSSGSAICDGALTYVGALSGTQTYNSLTATSAVTINTTTSNVLDATFAWSSVAGGQTANDNEASLAVNN